MKRNQETVPQKAERLKKNYRVIITHFSEAIVIGDHDTYKVSHNGGRWTCSCPWGRHKGHWKSCSHVLAAKQAMNDPASQAPVARLADLLIEARNRGLEGGWN